jgi:hypothetical protein
MEIATFYHQGTPGIEVYLGVDHSQALVEAVARRVLFLFENDRIGEISDFDADITECSMGIGINLKLTRSLSGLITDLDNFSNSSTEDIDTILDGRHNPNLKTNWRITARERLRMGRTALQMADKLRAVQADQDMDIVSEIAALGVYEGPNPDEKASRISFHARPEHSQNDAIVCERRRQRRTYCSRGYEQ